MRQQPNLVTDVALLPFEIEQGGGTGEVHSGEGHLDSGIQEGNRHPTLEDRPPITITEINRVGKYRQSNQPTLEGAHDWSESLLVAEGILQLKNRPPLAQTDQSEQLTAKKERRAEWATEGEGPDEPNNQLAIDS